MGVEFMRKIGQILSIWLIEPIRRKGKVGKVTHTLTLLTLLTLPLFTMGYIYYECF